MYDLMDTRKLSSCPSPDHPVFIDVPDINALCVFNATMTMYGKFPVSFMIVSSTVQYVPRVAVERLRAGLRLREPALWSPPWLITV